MKLVVKNNIGETVTLQIRPQETFVDLKRRVEYEAGISLDLNDIATNGKNIIDTQKVVEYFLSAPMPEAMKEDLPDVVCAVPGCSNTKVYNEDKVFFDFPQEEIRCHQWVLYCQRLSMMTGKHRLPMSSDSAICSDHFRADQFVKNTTTLLKRTAVPCINPELPAVESSKFGGAVPKVKPKVDEPNNEELHCRLCSRKCRDYIFIYGKEGRQLELAEKINELLPLNIKMTDHLPKQVCSPCIEELNAHAYFAKLSSDCQDKLMKDKLKVESVFLTDGEKTTLAPGKLCENCPLCTEGSLDQIIINPQKLNDSEKELVKEDIKIENSGESSDSTDNGELTFQTSEDEYYPCGICGDEFTDFTAIMQHCYTHFEDGYYQCSLCEECYPSAKSLVDHLFIHKPQEDLICENCKMAFKDNQDLLLHSCDPNAPMSKCKVCFKEFRYDYRYQNDGLCNPCRRKQNGELKQYDKHTALIEKNKCNDCGKVFSTVSSLRYHERTHQGTNCKPYVCEWCAKSFIRKSMLRNHVTTTHRLAQEASCFTCKICCEAFPSTDLAVSHMESTHAATSLTEQTYSFDLHKVTRLYACEFCEKHFAEGSVLNKHRETHVSDKPYCCKYCSMTFTTFAEQSEHKSKHASHEIPVEYICENTIPTTYLCEFCERCFFNYIKFTEHQTIHYGHEPYHCRYCNLKFATLDEVTKHRLSHGGQEPFDDFDFNRPYECHYCSKSFAIEDALVKHIRMHTGEKPFICDQCGKGFSQSSGLNTHKKVHSDLRPYSCPLCPRTFKIKGDRDVHIRKHSGDRPYKCEFCGKAFMTQHVYSQHRKIHTGERPYKCDVCGIAFRRSHVLTVHKRIHTGEKPNICDICGKRYRQKGDMLKHRRAQHSNLKLLAPHF